MLVGFTCRKGGSGVTTVTLSVAKILEKHKVKCCLVDLKNNGDYDKILNINSRQSNLDYLLTDYLYNDNQTEITKSIFHLSDYLDVVPGTRVKVQGYLYRKADGLKEFLDQLEDHYDIVFLDARDDQLLSKLIELGTHIYKVHVLDQNMLVTSLYQDVMQEDNLIGKLIVNKIDNDIYPSEDIFVSMFRNKKILFLPYSKDINSIINETIRNKGQFASKILVSVPEFYKPLVKFSEELYKTAKEYNEKHGTNSSESEDDFVNFLMQRTDEIRKDESKNRPVKKKKKGLFNFFSRG